MDSVEQKALRAIEKALLGSNELRRIQALAFHDAGLGYDKFGFHKESGILAYAWLRLLHERYFRTQSRGMENVPVSGGVILAANHSGVVPWDGAMIAVDVMSKTDPPRMPRCVVDDYAFRLPMIGLFLTRVGQIPGTRRNIGECLRAGHPVVVFPEGTRAMMKGFRERYRLRPFNVGHVELAIECKVPIVPVGVVGAEEQMPLIAASKPLGKMLGFPFLPITPFFPHLGPLGLIPLPVRYHILYGRPIRLHETASKADLRDPEALQEMARTVRRDVHALVAEGLDRRTGIFQ